MTNVERDPRPTLRVLPDLDAVAAAGAELFVEHARRAIAEHKCFRVALSGGSTPQRLHARLVHAPVDWSKVLVFFGDERCVPPEHHDSNYHMARESLLAKVSIPPTNVHRIYAESDDPHAAATEYERELERVFELEPGETPRFDLVLLGLGPDAHTASLFPGSSAVRETKKLVTATFVEKLGVMRVTFTARTIDAARAVVFVVAGADKAEAVHLVMDGPRDPERYPAQLVAPSDGELVWLLDSAAAGWISTGS